MAAFEWRISPRITQIFHFPNQNISGQGLSSDPIAQISRIILRDQPVICAICGGELRTVRNNNEEPAIKMINLQNLREDYAG